MTETASLTLVTFLAMSSLALLVFMLVGGRRNRLDERLFDLAGNGEAAPASEPMADLARAALPKMGAVMLPKSTEERTRLQSRLIHAGFYGRQAVLIFLGVKMLLMVGPAFLGFALGVAGVIPTQQGVIAGTLAGFLGMVAPSFWLDKRKSDRQTEFRRAIPDALDVIVICLEGGSSLAAALRRVAHELRTAHPLLASELNICQREIQLGRSAGEAIKHFGDRSDLSEIRNLASVVQQSERYGASLVKAMRVHAETLRSNRILYAEEMAQKAVIKMLLPTAVCIMPALFIVVLGPIMMEVVDQLRGLMNN
jgi:tight adherence protein C